MTINCPPLSTARQLPATLRIHEWSIAGQARLSIAFDADVATVAVSDSICDAPIDYSALKDSIRERYLHGALDDLLFCLRALSSQFQLSVAGADGTRIYTAAAGVTTRMHLPSATISVHEHERRTPQPLTIDVEHGDAMDFGAVGATVERGFRTIEALLDALLRALPDASAVTVHKPNAISGAADVSLRAVQPYPRIPSADVLLGLGSNQGDRAANIAAAAGHFSVENSSFLYESDNPYAAGQGPFLNAVIAVKWDADAHGLLRKCRSVEERLGRDMGAARNAARPIDIDILWFRGLRIGDALLTVPHPRMHGRDFVLQPLCDLYGKAHSWRPWQASRRTLLMGILNVSPDSFSGDGDDAQGATARGIQMLADGADILDVGGQSTRPGAELVSMQVELARVLPVVEALSPLCPVSIDTFRPAVAEACILRGACIVNDIAAGRLDDSGAESGKDGMFAVVARHPHVRYCMMHSRGTPSTMQSMTGYGDLLAEVRRELAERINRALAMGVLRWQIVVDPGIGFAKAAAQNVQLLRGPLLPPFPALVGASRKAFVGHITGQPVDRRLLGTAAAVTAAIVVARAAIVRVHDVREMRDVVRMADAIKEC